MDDSHDAQHAADILARSRTVAVVGFSTDPTKPSHKAPMELVRRGWDVIPVHPTADEIAGLPAVRSLADIDRHVDLVDVFRPSEQTPAVARAAADIGADALWLQLGITSAESRSIAEAAGMDFVEDQCVSPISRTFDVHPPA